MRLIVGLPLSLLIALTSPPAFAELDAQVELVPLHQAIPSPEEIPPPQETWIIAFRAPLNVIIDTRPARLAGAHPASPWSPPCDRRHTAFRGATPRNPNSPHTGPPRG